MGFTRLPAVQQLVDCSSAQLLSLGTNKKDNNVVIRLFRTWGRAISVVDEAESVLGSKHLAVALA